MRKLLIMYPDGRYHTVNANRFYSVMYQDKETYVIDYDDLTDNARNCFAILEKEGNTFVKRPLKDQSAYTAFAGATLYSAKRTYDLNVLPGKIGLCKEALVALKPVAPPVRQVNKPLAPPKRQVIVYRDISANHDEFPYYIDQTTARALGFMCSGPYYHLSPNLMDSFRRVFEVVIQDMYLSLTLENNQAKKPTSQAVAAGSPPPPPPGRGNGNGNGGNNSPRVFGTVTNVPPKGPTNRPEEVVVYEDISPIREEFPFYITQHDAKRFGLKVVEGNEYYHLKKVEFDVISRYAIIILEKKELAILPQKSNRVTKKKMQSVVPTQTVELNSKELETLENLFDGLMDFEDYYSFFGIEELRAATVEQVLSSPRVIALTKLFNKGVACNNDLAINLKEFLEGFTNDLRQKGKKF